jgi:hypothetical protein
VSENQAVQVSTDRDAFTLPRWLTILGILSALASLACGVFIVSILSGDSAAGFLVEIASIGCLAWFLIAGVLMVLQGAAESHRGADRH